MKSRSNAPAGWYPDPQNRARLRLWDGAKWVDHYAPNPHAPGDGQSDGSPVGAPSTDHGNVPPEPNSDTEEPTSGGFRQSTVKFLNDPLAQGAALGSAGAALAAGGAISFSRNKMTARILLIGLIVLAIGLLTILSDASWPGSEAKEITTVGTVTKIQKKSWVSGDCIPTVGYEVDGQTYTVKPSTFEKCTWEVGDTLPVAYTIASGGIDARLGVAKESVEPTSLRPVGWILTVVGFTMSLWSGVALAVRAGSVVGGVGLFMHGLSRIKNM